MDHEAQQDAGPGLPVGATDCHIHVFGPQSRFPTAPGVSVPSEALPAAIDAVFAKMGIARAVLVQPTVYGGDNRRHLSAAMEMRTPCCVVIATDPGIDPKCLTRLHGQGARGMRLVFDQFDALPPAILQALSARLAAAGWHLQMLLRPAQIVAARDRLAALACPLVLDHIGLVDPREGVAQPAVTALRRLLAGGTCWIKLSGLYRVSRQGAPYDDLAGIVRLLAETAPERLIWGSDWPHPAHDGPVPDLAGLLAPVADWVGGGERMRRILVDNPAELYGFAPALAA